jgi:hypothetical protein
MSAPTTGNRNLLKTIPGLLISAFFLWYTFRGISFAHLLALRAVHPAWILGVLGFTLASYTLRCVRWSHMMPRGMRSVRTHFLVCARVLMTSLAANNILPLRIGDVMRIFTYADDLGTSPSIILSTVILEKLLDIFVLVLMFVSTVGRVATPHLRLIANISLAISAIGLLVLLVAARSLQAPIQRLFTRLPANPKLAPKLIKIEHWITLALDATGRLGITGSLLLLLQTVIIWTCEGMIFASAIFLLGLPVDRIAPLAGSLLCESLLPDPQLSRSDRPLRTRSQNLSGRPWRIHVASRGLRPRDSRVDAYLRHRRGWNHLPDAPHPHPQSPAALRRDRRTPHRAAIAEQREAPSL